MGNNNITVFKGVARVTVDGQRRLLDVVDGKFVFAENDKDFINYRNRIDFISHYFNVQADMMFKQCDRVDLDRLFEVAEVGMMVSDFVKIASNTPVWYLYETGMNNVACVPTTIFSRLENNPIKNTFDLIYVTIPLLEKFGNRECVLAWMRTNRDKLVKLITLSIQGKLSRRYGIPVGCLRITEWMYTRDNLLAITLELKQTIT